MEHNQTSIDAGLTVLDPFMAALSAADIDGIRATFDFPGRDGYAVRPGKRSLWLPCASIWIRARSTHNAFAVRDAPLLHHGAQTGV